MDSVVSLVAMLVVLVVVLKIPPPPGGGSSRMKGPRIGGRARRSRHGPRLHH